jgi:hypothetical protein
MSGYTPESLEICKKIVRTVNAESGVWGPSCIVIGGLVPALLGIELPDGLSPHLGTTDVDFGVHIAAAAEESDLYRTLKSVLTTLNFRQTGEEPSFAWVRDVEGYPAKIELFCPVPNQTDAGRIQKKPFDESGSGLTALGVYGLELLEHDLERIQSKGPLLDDRGIKNVSVSVCGPAMLLLLKAWALQERTKDKDGYDVIWLLKALGPDLLASRYFERGLQKHDAGIRALEYLHEAFNTPKNSGPAGWVLTSGFEGDDAEREKREAHALVNAFLDRVNQT